IFHVDSDGGVGSTHGDGTRACATHHDTFNDCLTAVHRHPLFQTGSLLLDHVPDRPTPVPHEDPWWPKSASDDLLPRPQFCQKADEGLNTPEVSRQVLLLVRRVQIIIRQSEANHQSRNPDHLFDQPDNRYASSLTLEERRHPPHFL